MADDYFTNEFFQSLAEHLNDDPEFKEKTSDLDVKLLNVAKDKDRAFLLHINEGTMEVREADQDTEADFKFIGDYENWVANYQGDTNLEKSIMTGKIRLEGSIPKIMQIRDKLKVIDKAVAKMES